MDPDQLLQSLGVTLGLPDLRFDGNGCARIAVDGAPALNFERNANGGIHVYSVLGPLPPHDGREAIYTQLLKGNLFGTTTAGAALAIDEAHREIVMCRTIVTDLVSAHAFAAQVEAFVDAAEDWQGRLNSAPAELQLSESLPSPRLMEHFLRG